MARVADYEFSGATGATTVSDSSGNARDGAFTNGGKLDGSGNGTFDGTNDYAVIDADPGLELSEGTIIIEFVQDTASVGDRPYGADAAQTLFSVDQRGYGTDGGHLAIYIRSDGQVGVRHQDDAGSHYIWGGSVIPGQPVSVGYSWGPGGTSLVVNGVEVASTANTHLYLAADQRPMVIGASQANSETAGPDKIEGNFDGTISRVQIHDRPLGTSTPIPCFAAGTMIAVPGGEVAVERLRPGDLVLTGDRGAQPVRAVSHHGFRAADLAARPKLRPIRIAPGALGNARALIVSRQHALLLREEDVLVRAAHLARHGGGRFRVQQGCRRVDYHHLQFERHEIVFANGVPAESLLPDWQGQAGAARAPTVRPVLSGSEARALLARWRAGGARALREAVP